MANEKSLIGAEFQALPLDYLISTPLVAAVKAQRVAAESTQQFILSMLNDDGTPVTVDFAVNQKSADGNDNSIAVHAPLLAMVPVPHLKIDSLVIKFTFEISQTYRDAKETNKSINTSVSSGKALSPWVSASVKGSISSKATQDSTTNRSGQLDITVQASEAAIPEGLARVLSLMTSAIQTPGSADANPSTPAKPDTKPK
ncbi:DUF2589 domain-containing protein [Pseudomaricurvus alcaniphilus]|uniref:DUF2589 domain-containing protein n=1 Tax=Pseudomaricurvus alcaniphilus TaxID=1166482 RepID=UPI00140953B4|nr:DUF2589 domain-containing protein [Pseudomaricurvus alcaniphilus]NHN37158.1 DUF2589 domain-containing protein [Pseudomaricurvus alcaniphilus]